MIVGFEHFAVGFVCGGIIFGVIGWLSGHERAYRKGRMDARLEYHLQGATPLVIRETGPRKSR